MIHTRQMRQSHDPLVKAISLRGSVDHVILDA